MKKPEIKSYARFYEHLPKIPTIITRNYNKSPHAVRYKLWLQWGLDKKPTDWYTNPEFADIFGMTRDEVIENNKRIAEATGTDNPYGDVLLPDSRETV